MARSGAEAVDVYSLLLPQRAHEAARRMRSQPERTGREDRRSKFYEITDNLLEPAGTSFRLRALADLDESPTVLRAASPTAQRLVGGVEDLVAATLRDDAPAAAKTLEAIAQRRVELEGRQGVTTLIPIAVHRRDCWTCRYCRARTVAPPF